MQVNIKQNPKQRPWWHFWIILVKLNPPGDYTIPNSEYRIRLHEIAGSWTGSGSTHATAHAPQCPSPRHRNRNTREQSVSDPCSVRDVHRHGKLLPLVLKMQEQTALSGVRAGKSGYLSLFLKQNVRESSSLGQLWMSSEYSVACLRLRQELWNPGVRGRILKWFCCGFLEAAWTLSNFFLLLPFKPPGRKRAEIRTAWFTHSAMKKKKIPWCEYSVNTQRHTNLPVLPAAGPYFLLPVRTSTSTQIIPNLCMDFMTKRFVRVLVLSHLKMPENLGWGGTLRAPWPISCRGFLTNPPGLSERSNRAALKQQCPRLQLLLQQPNN